MAERAGPEDGGFRAQFREAAERGERARQRRPRARCASYDAERDLVVLELESGCVFGFPPGLAQGLSAASPDELAKVEVLPGGDGIHFESLDVDLLVAPLLMGVFGSKAWMSELGRAGGRARTEAKARAARRNGLKGGRPPRKSGD